MRLLLWSLYLLDLCVVDYTYCTGTHRMLSFFPAMYHLISHSRSAESEAPGHRRRTQAAAVHRQGAGAAGRHGGDHAQALLLGQRGRCDDRYRGRGDVGQGGAGAASRRGAHGCGRPGAYGQEVLLQADRGREIEQEEPSARDQGGEIIPTSVQIYVGAPPFFFLDSPCSVMGEIVCRYQRGFCANKTLFAA